MDGFKEKLQRAPKFLFILTALFGHQPTYKNLRGTLVVTTRPPYRLAQLRGASHALVLTL